MGNEQMHAEPQISPGPDSPATDAVVAEPATAAPQPSQMAAAREAPTPAPRSPPPGRDEVVAAALDDLATQIKHAASALRYPDPAPPGTPPPQGARCDPQSIIDLVMDDLSRRGIKAAFGPEADLADAARSAARLLQALGVTPM
jgi:hypothetical protein